VIIVGSTQNLQRIWYESTINTQMLLLKQLKTTTAETTQQRRSRSVCKFRHVHYSACTVFYCHSMSSIINTFVRSSTTRLTQLKDSYMLHLTD